MKRMNFYYKRPVMTDACAPQEGTGLYSELLLTGSFKVSWEVICSYQFDCCDPVRELAQYCPCYRRAMHVEGRLSLGWAGGDGHRWHS